jgi:hypothetical protein
MNNDEFWPVIEKEAPSIPKPIEIGNRGYVRGVKFYLGLTYKRIKGKLRVIVFIMLILFLWEILNTIGQVCRPSAAYGTDLDYEK